MSTLKPIDPHALDVFAGWDTPENPALKEQRRTLRAQDIEDAQAEDRQQGRVATRAMLELDRQHLKGWVGSVESYRNTRTMLANVPPRTPALPQITEEETHRRAEASHEAIVSVALSGFTFTDAQRVDFIRHDAGDLTHDEFIALCTQPAQE